MIPSIPFYYYQDGGQMSSIPQSVDIAAYIDKFNLNMKVSHFNFPVSPTMYGSYGEYVVLDYASKYFSGFILWIQQYNIINSFYKD